MRTHGLCRQQIGNNFDPIWFRLIWLWFRLILTKMLDSSWFHLIRNRKSVCNKSQWKVNFSNKNRLVWIILISLDFVWFRWFRSNQFDFVWFGWFGLISAWFHFDFVLIWILSSSKNYQFITFLTKKTYPSSLLIL